MQKASDLRFWEEPRISIATLLFTGIRFKLDTIHTLFRIEYLCICKCGDIKILKNLL